MPNRIDDINNFEGRLRNQVEQVQQLDSRDDAQAIVRWANAMQVGLSTKVGRVNCVKKLAERADRPLVTFDASDDVYDLLERFRTGQHPMVKDEGLAEGSLRQYRQAARLFFRDELDREWAEDIEIGQVEPSPIGPDQILAGHEVDALLEEATNPRDRALIAFLVVTGQRITAALSIRVDDVDLGADTGTVRLNDDAIGLKGASGPRPLLWARPYIANWLEVHPDRHASDAPLFCATQGGERPREDGATVSWEPGDPLSRSQAQRRIREVAEDAGVPTEKVKLHNFRHTAITRMREEGVHDDRIRFMVGVEPDSDILERYDQATNEEMLERIRDHHDIAGDGDAKVGRPTIEQCPDCRAPVRESAAFCADCGSPLTFQARESLNDGTEGAADDMVAIDDPEKRALAKELIDALRNDPEFVDTVVDGVDDHGSSS